jgi:hypothetical protein
MKAAAGNGWDADWDEDWDAGWDAGGVSGRVSVCMALAYTDMHRTCRKLAF